MGSLKRVLAGLIVLLSLAPPASANDLATVYVYRIEAFMLRYRKITTVLDGNEVVRLQNGRYFVMKLQPGNYLFSDKKAIYNIKLKLEPGKTYYVRAEFKGLKAKVQPMFSLVDPQSARDEIRELKPSDGGEVKNRAIPILRIFDVEKAKEFYVEYLGFKVDWEHRFEDNSPLNLQVSLGEFVLHLSEHYGDGCPGSTVFVKVTGLEESHKELAAKNYKYLRPRIGDAPWKAKCVKLN